MPDTTTATPRLPSAEEKAAASAAGMNIALWGKYTPDAVAIISPTGDRTFEQLNSHCNRLVRALHAKGLKAGDSVAIVLSNRPEFAESVFACTRGGFRYTPINRHLSPDEVAYIVNDCGAKCIIGDARFIELMADTATLCPNATARLAVGGDIPGFEPFEILLAAEDGADLEAPELGTRMLYTSGTTGRPKGVVRKPNYSTRLEAITSAPRYLASSGQMNLCTGPYYHGGPLTFSLLAPLNAGVGIVIMEKWDASEALRLIEKYRITHTHMVPTMFHRLLRLPEVDRRAADVSSLQYVLHGAAPCSEAIKRGMMNWFGPVLWEYFAATEGSGASCSPAQWLQKPGTVGLPPAPDHVRILNAAGEPCAAGEVGNIFLKGDGELEFEYLGDPEKTAEAHRHSHFTVGDIGYLDEDGFLFVTDRDSNIIVSGGVNIYPAEVEATLLTHPEVKDAAVIGVPDEEWGEEVKAVVQLDQIPDDSAALEQALIDYCREHIAHFKCPRSVDLVINLPRDDNGKLYRRKLLEHYRRSHTG